MAEITISDALSLAHGAKKAIEEGYDVPMMMLAAARLADELDNIKASAEAAKEELRKAREQEPVAWLCGKDVTQNHGYALWFQNYTKESFIPIYAATKPAALPYLCDGKRFKISINGEGGTYCFEGHPELDGKWVALVDATDNQHMQAPKPAAPAVPDALRMELEWLEGWLHCMAEPMGQACCKRSMFECCGSPDPVYPDIAHIGTAMSKRRNDVIALMQSAGEKK